MKIKIEKIEGNRKEATVRGIRNQSFGEEIKMEFSGKEVVFYRLKIRSLTVNVTKVKEEPVEGLSSHLGSILKEYLGVFMIPSHEGGFDTGYGVP